MDLNENIVQRKPGNIYWQGLTKPYGIHFVTAQRKTGRACVFVLWLQTVCSSRAVTVSVVVPDLCSFFPPKLNLKQGLLSHPEGHIFALIKTMSLMDKDGGVGNSQWGMFFFIGCRSLLGRLHSRVHVKSEFFIMVSMTMTVFTDHMCLIAAHLYNWKHSHLLSTSRVWCQVPVTSNLAVI